MPGVYSIKEHEPIRTNGRLSERDIEDLKGFARSNQYDQQGNYRPVLQFDRSGGLRAGNYVGIITTKRRNIVEILPKIDFAGKADPDHEETRRIFLNMLRSSRRLRAAAQFRYSAIRALRRFPMLDVFRAPLSREPGVVGPRRPRPEVSASGGESALPAGPSPVPGSNQGESDRPIAIFRAARRTQRQSPRQSAHSEHALHAQACRAKRGEPATNPEPGKRPSSRCRQRETYAPIGANTAWTAPCSTTSRSCGGSACFCSTRA